MSINCWGLSDFVLLGFTIGVILYSIGWIVYDLIHWLRGRKR